MPAGSHLFRAFSRADYVVGNSHEATRKKNTPSHAPSMVMESPGLSPRPQPRRSRLPLGCCGCIPQAWKGWMREAIALKLRWQWACDRAWFWAPEEPGLESRLLLQVACPQLRSLEPQSSLSKMGEYPPMDAYRNVV